MFPYIWFYCQTKVKITLIKLLKSSSRSRQWRLFGRLTSFLFALVWYSKIFFSFCMDDIDPFLHDDIIKWIYFPHHWLIVWEIHCSPVNSTHKGQWRGALMFSLISARINGWLNNREAGDLRHHCIFNSYILILAFWLLHLFINTGFLTMSEFNQCV